MGRFASGKDTHMSRKFIAAVLAVSTAIATFSAAPARALSDEDIAKLLAGAATVFIIGRAIDSSRDKDRDKDRDKTYKRSDTTTYSQTYRPFRNIDTYREIPKVVPRNTHKHDRYAALPRKCVRRVEGGHVKRVVMGRCLERHYHSARALPNRCRMRVSTQRGIRPAYSLPCLRHRGYTLARN